jgi:hypothetical protein
MGERAIMGQQRYFIVFVQETLALADMCAYETGIVKSDIQCHFFGAIQPPDSCGAGCRVLE